MNEFDVKKFNVAEFDRILSYGLSPGLGQRGKSVCIEAAICQVLNLPHGDDPGCVAAAVRAFKIRLNDSRWSSPKARAAGLRDLGLAQLGSKGVVGNQQFAKLLADRTIRVLLPTMIRDLFPTNEKLIAAALVCEQEGTKEASQALRKAAAAAAYADASAAAYADASAAASAAASADASADAAASAAASAAADASASAAASASAYVSAAAKRKKVSGDKYLLLEASLALEVLRELKSPGVELLEKAACPTPPSTAPRRRK